MLEFFSPSSYLHAVSDTQIYSRFPPTTYIKSELHFWLMQILVTELNVHATCMMFQDIA